MTRLDILLPYWGEFSLLKKTIDSVLAQTSAEWHLTIVDDHYPSLEAMEYVSSLHDERITYIRHEKNIGITNNFNFCLDRASAEYCMLLGCDDRLLPNYVERALERIGGAGMYQPYVAVIDAHGDAHLPLVDRVKRLLMPRRSGVYSGEPLAASLCTGNWLYFPSIMWRTETLKRYRFDPQYTVVEDLVVELSMIIDGATMYFDRSTTFEYRRFAESVSSKEKKKGGVRFDEEAAVYRMFAQKFDEIGWKKASRQAGLRLISRIHSYLT